ncbi:MAG: 5-deoxy-glucuronate isomerase [Intrasporangium sp.]|uniref:5-deoxy-glucuronate isomerase n=1 Tax=Intrasporangium sp. TaxID=1925024 RepID=UPI00264958A4|nr:5-deoxy-glucuronate isomerase [Intrasporangium sp.]MDN5797092.1 5-deoxy-glucuronate isomerase [Intrasporangium sp.]
MSGRDNDQWVRPLGTAERDGWQVCIDASLPGWEHTSLYVAELAAGGARTLAADEWEHIVVPLSGAVTVESDGQQLSLQGRSNVFAGPTDVAYVARDLALTVTANGGPARVAVCGAKASERHTPSVARIARENVPVEMRGAGLASREVRNFGTPATLDANAIIACEVLTPAGNWSSYPPHKHDEERPGQETQLEEIYYYELAGGPEAVGYQRVYGTSERPIDVLAEVRAGDVVLVPHGWHGPTTAPPGYDIYYLNVMAGPGTERAWLICDDPAHAWVRETWPGQAVDPRLPFGGKR